MPAPFGFPRGPALALLTAACALWPGTAAAQRRGGPDSVYQYPAKFVCGSPSGRLQRQLLAPGRYFTVINVRNRSADSIEIRKRFALALPLERTGPVSQAVSAAMGPGQALTIACPDIREHAGLGGAGLAEGFAVIESPVELDVTAVYTAGAHGVSTMHVERCPGTRVALCEPLEMRLHTGLAPWMVVQTPSGPVTPTPVTPIPVPDPAWSTALSPARWVFSGSQVAGTYGYELQFCLCEGFEEAGLWLQVLADNQATVFLNGVQIFVQPGGNVTSNFTGPPTGVGVVAPFQPGNNVLRVLVQNGGNVTGFALAGTLTAARGRCP